jgi:hypothetical protein
MMHGREKSDLIVVAMKSGKLPVQAGGEPAERRVRAKGKAEQVARTGHRAGYACIPTGSVYGTRTLCRHHPRWEPGALIGHAGFCAGGAR